MRLRSSPTAEPRMSSPLIEPSGCTAVITGAASGFGRELALQCAALGLNLVLTDLDNAGLERTRELAGLDNRRVLLQRCDVADAAGGVAEEQQVTGDLLVLRHVVHDGVLLRGAVRQRHTPRCFRR